jgi:hypothetical protein
VIEQVVQRVGGSAGEQLTGQIYGEQKRTSFGSRKRPIVCALPQSRCRWSRVAFLLGMMVLRK